MILDRILADTRALIAQRQAETPLEALRKRATEMPEPLSLLDAMSRPGVSLIAEIKRASPSKGALNMAMDPRQQAACYAGAGAEGISVLTEPTHFRGSLEDLTLARQGAAGSGHDVPLLRKDFIVSDYQLYEARAFGADAALLIVAALEDEELAQCLALALNLGLSPLVEVHNRAELDRALAVAPPLIGINNRDLRTFEVSLETTRRLRDAVPPGTLLISESGIHEPEQMAQLAAMGVDGALVGEALVKADDPAEMVRALKEAGR